MNIRTVFFSVGVIAALLIFSGCVSTPPAGTGLQLEAEVSMLQEQSEQIIAEVQKRNSRGADRIIPADELIIEVWMRDRKTQFDGFPFRRQVPSSGRIFIPSMGLTMVTGKTDAEVKVLLSEHFDKILKNATVVVEHGRELVQGQPVLGKSYVSLLGWVVKPGLYTLEPGLTTLRDLVANGGGMKEFANTRRVYVVRGDVDDPQIMKIDFARIRIGKAHNIILFHNDAVYVPPVRMWRGYDFIRIVLLPLTAVRDAVGFVLPWTTTN